jgi:MFS family permease
LNSPQIDRNPSLRYAIYDGFFYSLMVGFGDTYLSAYAIFLGADNAQLGILSALPPFLAGLSQLLTVRLMKAYPSRRKLLSSLVFIQALFFIPMALSHNIPRFPVELYIFFVICFMATGAIGGPIWNSWIGDLVAPEKRGQYFGFRNRVITIGTFTSMVAAGLTLRFFKDLGIEYLGFYLIFAGALTARLLSCFFLSKKTDIAQAEIQGVAEGFWKFVRHIRKKNQGILILYMASINFAVFLSAAYFAPFLLRTHKLSYSTYTLVISGVALTKFMTSPFWGEVCDNLGSRRVLRWTGFLIPFSTIPWIFTGDPVTLFIAQCFSGFLWGGYELATFNFLLDATQPHERARVTSYSNLLSSTAALLGAVSGVILIHNGPIWYHQYGFIFAVTAVVRVLALIIFTPKLKEVRVISPVRTRDVLYKATGFKAAVGLTSRLVVISTGSSKIISIQSKFKSRWREGRPPHDRKLDS